MTEDDDIDMRRRVAAEDLLQEAGFEPAADDGAELRVRPEEGVLKLYARPEALREARKGTA